MTTSTTLKHDRKKLAKRIVRDLIKYRRAQDKCNPCIPEACLGSKGERADLLSYQFGGDTWLDEVKIDAQDVKNDAKKDWRIHPQKGMGKYRTLVAPVGLVQPWIVTDPESVFCNWILCEWSEDGSIRQVEPSPTQTLPYFKIRAWDREWELLRRYACRTDVAPDAETSSDPQRGLKLSDAPRFPEHLADMILADLTEHGRAGFGVLWNAIDDLRMHAGWGKGTDQQRRNCAKKSLNSTLDAGLIKGFHRVTNGAKTEYDVESRL